MNFYKQLKMGRIRFVISLFPESARTFSRKYSRSGQSRSYDPGFRTFQLGRTTCYLLVVGRIRLLVTISAVNPSEGEKTA